MKLKFCGEHRLREEECDAACQVSSIVNSVEDSKQLNETRDPAIIISASGMATAGRVVHHLKAFAPDPRNMVAGASWIRIHGEDIPVRAEVVNINSFSAHADSAELLSWLRNFRASPSQIFLTHGEPAAAAALQAGILSEFGWTSRVAGDLEEVSL